MTKKYISYLLSFAVVVILFWFQCATGKAESDDHGKNSGSAAQPSVGPTPSGVKFDDPSVTSPTGQNIKTFFAALEKAGVVHESPPLISFLTKAIESKDQGEILRAFRRAYYSNAWAASDVAETIKRFVNDPDPFVRLCAGHALLVIGESGGYETLVGLVNSDQPLPGIGIDSRIEAAEYLSQFKQSDASEAISRLYSATKSPELSLALSNLGIPLPGFQHMPFVPSPLAIEEYAKTNATRFLPQIDAVFHGSNDVALKSSAAWALATLSGDKEAIRFLISTAAPVIGNPSTKVPTANPGSTTAILGIKALKYLGSIRDSDAKDTLKAALNSMDGVVVRIATVNLIFNQGGASEATALVAQELRGTEHRLGPDLALDIAAMVHDPELESAGQVYSKHNGLEIWELHTVTRKNWPIYNWVDNYVVRLNN